MDGLVGLHFVVKPNHRCIAGGFTFMKVFQSIAWIITALVAALHTIQKADATNKIRRRHDTRWSKEGFGGGIKSISRN